MEGGETHGASTWSRVLHWYRLHNAVAEKGSLFLFQAGEPKVVGEGIFGISQGDNTGVPASRVLTRPTHSRLFPNQGQKTNSVTK